MLKLARLDAPGALHHIMIRGIERRNIFKDDKECDSFIRLRQNTLQLVGPKRRSRRAGLRGSTSGDLGTCSLKAKRTARHGY